MARKIASMMANTKAPPTHPIQNSFPAWYLRRGTMNATEAALESASSSCERWGAGCAVAVVLAVVAETALAVIHPSYDSLWNRVGSSIADAVIAIGIVGEVLFSRWDARIQTELRRRSNDKLGVAERAAAEANEKAERERTARLELEERLTPRTFSAPQRREIAAALSSFWGIKIDIISYAPGFPEVNNASGLLVSAIDAAHWEVRPWSAIASAHAFEGVFVAIKPGSSEGIRQAAKALVAALQKAEWGTQEFISPVNWREPAPFLVPEGWDPDDPAPIRIMIGFKPNMYGTAGAPRP